MPHNVYAIDAILVGDSTCLVSMLEETCPRICPLNPLYRPTVVAVIVSISGALVGTWAERFASRSWASCLLTLPHQSSQLQETGAQKGVCGLNRFNGLTD